MKPIPTPKQGSKYSRFKIFKKKIMPTKALFNPITIEPDTCEETREYKKTGTMLVNMTVVECGKIIADKTLLDKVVNQILVESHEQILNIISHYGLLITV